MQNILINQKQPSLYSQYLRDEVSTDSFAVKRNVMSNDVVKMTLTEWQTPDLKAHLMQTKANKNIRFVGRIDQRYLMLHFVLGGEFYIKGKKQISNTVRENANNIFFSYGDGVEHQYRENLENTFFKVLLPYEYIFSKREQYPQIFDSLVDDFEKHRLMVGNKNMTTTPEMRTVIQQLMHASEMGNLAPFYFETKIQELLVLQMQQFRLSNFAFNNSYEQYSNQIDEVKNIIEMQYNKPLTIALLAQTVGMSETMLKMAFKSKFGTTIYNYLFTYRMQIAKSLLLDNSLSVAEVAFKSGYEYPSHFTTAFKRKYGLSPMDFRTNYF